MCPAGPRVSEPADVVVPPVVIALSVAPTLVVVGQPVTVTIVVYCGTFDATLRLLYPYG